MKRLLTRGLILGMLATLTSVVFGVEFKTVTAKEVLKLSKNKDVVVVDARIGDAYNGWAMDGMKSGGHIDGATDFASNWLTTDVKDKDKILQETLKTKGITKDKQVIIYDANDKDAKQVGEYFTKVGIKNISILDIKEWEKEKLPLVSYANYKLLAPAVVINEMLKDKKNKVFEVAWGEEAQDEDYKAGHLVGAVHINTDEIEFPPLWSIKSDKELLQFAKNNGITKNDSVILYGADPMASYRIGVILEYLGVAKVTILNGGTEAWKVAKLPLEKKSNPKVAVADFGSDKPLNKKLIVGINEAKDATTNPAKQLVDIRSWDEYIGKTSGYADLKYKGRPAGSVWGKAGSDPNHLQEYRNIDNTMRNGYEILDMWKKLGIDYQNKKLSFMCGSGWRAAEVLYYSQIIGVKSADLYSNGWYEWSADSKNKVLLGEKN